MTKRVLSNSQYCDQLWYQGRLCERRASWKGNKKGQTQRVINKWQHVFHAAGNTFQAARKITNHHGGAGRPWFYADRSSVCGRATPLHQNDM
jgi:hypothetical protein